MGYLSEIFRIGYAKIKSNLKPLLLGQLLSILLASTSASNDTLHFECNLSAPTLQAGLIYFFLSFALIGVANDIEEVGSGNNEDFENDRPLQQQKVSTMDIDTDDAYDYEISGETRIQALCRYISQHVCLFRSIKGSPLLYFIMALLDVQANYFTFLAYRYTTLTSVSLLDAVAIPSAIFFSRVILRRSYKLSHFLGAGICITGVIANVLIDYEEENVYYPEGDDDHVENNLPNQLRGDVMAVIGASIYGLNNVLTERAVKHAGGVKEYLGMLGLFGTLISIVQGSILDRAAVMEFFTRVDDNCTASKGFGLLFLSAFFGFTAYVGISNFLTKSESALLNLSLLTGDLWAVVFTVVAQGMIPTKDFWVALVLIFIGVIVYELSGSPISEENDESDGDTEFIRRGELLRQQYEGVTAQHLRELDMPDEII